MSYFPSKSTILLQNNLISPLSTCVDCGVSDINYYSFGYKVYLCVKCAQVHDLYLGKYSSSSQLRYSKSSDCLLVSVEQSLSLQDQNVRFNKEFELFLPEFFQKMGHKTPQVIRKEFIISKYSHKTFCSPEGIQKFLPDIKLGILWKKRLKGPGWRPCFTKLDALRGTLEYYSHKSSKLLPKASINLRGVEVFIEQMTREVRSNIVDGESYLHIACEQNRNLNRTKMFSIHKKSSVTNTSCAEPEISQIRNFYFRPTTDLELFRWYFSIMSIKHAFVSKQAPNATRNNHVIKRQFTFDCSLTGTDTNLCTILEPTDGKSVFSSPSKADMCPLDIDPMISLPDAPAPSPFHRDTFKFGNMELTLGNMELNLFSSGFQDCPGESLQLGCCNLIGQDNELDISVRTVPLGCELSEKFYSCPPGTDTNPFSAGPPSPHIHGPDTGTNSPIHCPDNGTNSPIHCPDTGTNSLIHGPDTGTNSPIHGPDTGTNSPIHGPDTGTNSHTHCPDTGTNSPIHCPDTGTNSHTHCPDTGTNSPIHCPDTGTNSHIHCPDTGTNSPIHGPDNGTNSPIHCPDTGTNSPIHCIDNGTNSHIHGPDNGTNSPIHCPDTGTNSPIHCPNNGTNSHIHGPDTGTNSHIHCPDTGTNSPIHCPDNGTNSPIHGPDTGTNSPIHCPDNGTNSPIHVLYNETNSPVTANQNLFPSDLCPIYSDYETFPPPNSEDKTSWISTPVEVPQRNIVPCPLPPTDPLCPLPIDYTAIRGDTSRGRKYHVMSGWLEKVGEHKNDIWRLRWFTLFNTHVTYSETPLSACPKGHFCVGPDTEGYSVDTLKSKNHILSPPNGFIFRVVTPGRLYHLCAQSEIIRRDWINGIASVIAFANVLK